MYMFVIGYECLTHAKIVYSYLNGTLRYANTHTSPTAMF